MPNRLALGRVSFGMPLFESLTQVESLPQALERLREQIRAEYEGSRRGKAIFIGEFGFYDPDGRREFDLALAQDQAFEEDARRDVDAIAPRNP